MIFKHDLKLTAEKFIDANFRDSSRRVLLDPIKFNAWIDLAHVRINEVEQMLFFRGINPTKNQIERYIQHGVLFYAKAQFKELSGASEQLENKIANTRDVI